MKFTKNTAGTHLTTGTGTQDQGHKTQEHHSGKAKVITSHSHQDTNTPRHQNTMVANQAYTFNGTTPNANVNYAPGTFNMGTPLNTYQAPYNQQQNQSYTQNQQYHNNSFAEQSSKTTQQDATAIIEQLRQLLLQMKQNNHYSMDTRGPKTQTV